MEKFEVGTVVLIIFPFSNLKGEKLRPAIVVAKAEFENVILCQITSRPYSSKKAVKLLKSDFQSGGLPITSYIRPDKLFTAENTIVKRSVGKINKKKRKEILTNIRKIFS